MPYPDVGFPIPPFEWPHVGRQWPPYNVESDQAEGLVMWMPYGGGYPGLHQHVDLVSGLVFTESGAPTWIFDSKYGWSMLFDDAATDYLNHGSAVLTGPPLTVSCRFLSDNDTADQALLNIHDTDANSFYYLFLRGSRVGNEVGWFTRLGAAQAFANSSAGYATNTWQHAAGVENAGNSRASFLNGENKGTNATDVTPTSLDTTRIAEAPRGGGAPMSGRIMDIRTYNIAKTDAQVYQMDANPWELWSPPRRLWVLAPGAPAADAMPMAMDMYGRFRRV